MELPITAAVGAPPARNLPADVSIVQYFLTKVTPALATRVSVTGTMDPATLSAIREFQKRFMSYPDSRVDPDGRTIWHLNDGFVSRYIRCNADQRRTLDRDIINAQKWLTEVLKQFGTMSASFKLKIKNIFHIDIDDRSQAGRLLLLLARYQRLRASFDEEFPLECVRETSLYGAWVIQGDRTGVMHFPTNYFQMDAEERTEKVIHERSHTVFGIVHDGMLPSGQVDAGQSADDDNGFTFDQAMNNAYCFGWLATAAQPGYVPSGGGEVIIAPRHH